MDAEELQKKLDDLAALAERGIITTDERRNQRAALIAAYSGVEPPPGRQLPPAPPSIATIPAVQPPVMTQLAPAGGNSALKYVAFGCLGILAFIGIGVVVFWVAVVLLFASDDDTRSLITDNSLITGNARDLTVSVGGDPGIAFSGNLGSISGQRSIEGVTPGEFTISGEDSSGIFVAVIQKQQEDGHITLTLNCHDGAKTTDTAAVYGVVTLSCSP
jgi:hypothetical protein